jgi:GDP/UDP-N,N'-diacetylbacillosamine 2-epimerase (hydrolysing)
MSSLMKRKVCIITGSRADYGLLRLVMKGISDDPGLTLQVIATGTHLSQNFGMTYKEIEDDGFIIDFKVEILNSLDSPVGIANSMGKGLIGCAKAFESLKPDLVVVLGDRYEIFAAAAAALVARIPIAHLHGGESTIGAFDEAFRHSITKMSQLHFVATEEYRKRVIQLGEDPEKVFLVGGLGVDNLKNIDLLNKVEIESLLGVRFLAKSLLVTFHPVTLEDETAEEQTKELLSALSELTDTTLIFTMPNADNGGLAIMNLIEKFVNSHSDAYSFKSLGQHLYLSCIPHVDGVVGNSSSGLAEVPSFKKGTINVGSRQLGRVAASSVINCDPEQGQIRRAIERLYSEEFRIVVADTLNPYGEGGASLKIVDTLRGCNLDGIIQKNFNDL